MNPPPALHQRTQTVKKNTPKRLPGEKKGKENTYPHKEVGGGNHNTIGSQPATGEKSPAKDDRQIARRGNQLSQTTARTPPIERMTWTAQGRMTSPGGIIIGCEDPARPRRNTEEDPIKTYTRQTFMGKIKSVGPLCESERSRFLRSQVATSLQRRPQKGEG